MYAVSPKKKFQVTDKDFSNIEILGSLCFEIQSFPFRNI